MIITIQKARKKSRETKMGRMEDRTFATLVHKVHFEKAIRNCAVRVVGLHILKSNKNGGQSESGTFRVKYS